MKIASIQLNIKWEDKTANLNQAHQFIKRAKQEGCDLVVFPEFFTTGFSMDAKKISEPPGGQTAQFLSTQAKQNSINIIGGYAESTPHEKAKNVAIAVNREGHEAAKYVKNHPFSFANEHQHYQPGNKQVTFKIDNTSASIFICYDLRFPEVFRKIAKQVDIIFVIANWPQTRQKHWEALLKARAIENQCYVAGINRTGTDGNNIEYCGASSIINPLGNTLSYGKATQQYITTTINTEETQNTRYKFPFLNDIKFI